MLQLRLVKFLFFFLIPLAWAELQIANPITKSPIRVRKTPSADGAVIGSVQNEILIVEKRENFLEIREGKFEEAFVAASLFALEEGDILVAQNSRAGVRVREKPDGKIVGALGLDERFAAKREGAWLKILKGRFKDKFVSASLFGFGPESN